MRVPNIILTWFFQRQWRMHAYQKAMFRAFKNKNSTLLIAPTGGGKTLASFLPSIYDIHRSQYKGLHTLYISPLKSLTYDIQRNLLIPIKEMQLNVTVDLRTGDTSSYRRRSQRQRPPHILLTTPESLMLLLSYEGANEFFSTTKLVIVDELHNFTATKRGDLTSLALSRISYYAPEYICFGLSATVTDPERLALWLGGKQKAARILRVKSQMLPKISLLTKDSHIPYCGHLAKYACAEIYKIICTNQITLIFVNTRAQAELMFKEIWNLNEQNLPIGIYHGSLAKEQRLKTTELAANGKLRALVSTSALELGIDWGNVDCVIQVGAPKGVSRLLQRIGRSNHQFNKASYAFLVPANCFEVLECQAAIEAIEQQKFDGESVDQGSLDVVIQFIVNCACSEPVFAEDLYQQIHAAYPYRNLERIVFMELLQFAINGGYVLQHYTQYHRLKKNADGSYEAQNQQIKKRHRQNIGTIVEAAKLKVRRINKRGGRILGEIEENFIQQLMPGDTFLFSGEVLEFVRIRDMLVEAKKTSAAESKIPSYNGGTMPLSTYLAEKVLKLINTPHEWQKLPTKMVEWLQLQQHFSLLPPVGQLLVEHFPYKKAYHTVFYYFAGRRANHTLGVVLALRMEMQKLHPLSFTATDYGVTVSSLKQLTERQINLLLDPALFKKELEYWLEHSPAVKRAFRYIAIISGLIERQLGGQRKTMKQVTFSTDLIYDVLHRYEPQHILLSISRHEVEHNLLEMHKLISILESFVDNIVVQFLPRPSPLSLPVLLAIKTERLRGSAEEELLTLAAVEQEAVELIAGVRTIVRQ